MSDEERKQQTEARKGQRERIQDRVYDMITSTTRQTQQVLDRLESAGVQVPAELGDQIYAMTMDQLEHQTKMLKSVQEGADRVLDRYWNKQRAQEAGTNLELVTREKGQSLLVQLVVENPGTKPIKVSMGKVEHGDLQGAVIKALPLGQAELQPSQSTAASWVVDTKKVKSPTLIRFRVAVATDLGETARTYELTVL